MESRHPPVYNPLLMSDVTLILAQIDAGDPRAAEQLLPLVYNELRRIAAQRLAQERPGQTLQATALVHEAWLRLVGSDNSAEFNSRGHFFAAAAEAMRRILVENARTKLTQKRGSGALRQDLDSDELAANSDRVEQTIAISDALEVLAGLDPSSAELLKLRYFGGFSMKESAQVLGISETTAYEQWRFAKTWLRTQLG